MLFIGMFVIIVSFLILCFNIPKTMLFIVTILAMIAWDKAHATNFTDTLKSLCQMPENMKYTPCVIDFSKRESMVGALAAIMSVSSFYCNHQKQKLPDTEMLANFVTIYNQKLDDRMLIEVRDRVKMIISAFEKGKDKASIRELTCGYADIISMYIRNVQTLIKPAEGK